MLSNNNLNAGGPPIQTTTFTLNTDTNINTCTDDNYQLYDNVQQSIDCVLKTDEKSVKPGSLAYSVNIANTQPFSCMLNLLTGHYSDCDVNIPLEKRKEAFAAFQKITGYKPLNIDAYFNDLSDYQTKMLEFSSFYIFMPTLILSFFVILFLVITKFINWVDGLYLFVIALIILFGFSILYRFNASKYISEKSASLQNAATTSQTNFEDNFAYWIQGFFAMSCSLTSKDGKGWTCNKNCNPCDKPDKPCNRKDKKKNKREKPCKKYNSIDDKCNNDTSECSDNNDSDSSECSGEIIV
jgi:hypothetical protein